MNENHAGNRLLVPQYGAAMILIATFLPALLKAFAGIATRPLSGFATGIDISAYLLLEAFFFIVVIYFLGRRDGAFDFKTAIPYQARLNPLVFLALLVGVSVYAIFFRDFFRWAPLMNFAGYLRELLSFWPPEWLYRPGFGFEDENAAKATRIGTLIFGMISISAASAVQTIYFRGFLLPRMEYLGWAAPVLNTALFAMFHIHSPAFWHLFFIFTLGWGVVAYAVRNVWVVAISHVIFNTYSLFGAIYAAATS